VLTHTGETGVLELQPAELASGSDDFLLEDQAVVLLEPGKSTTITLTYTPRDGVHDTGTVIVDHNIADQPALEIPIFTIPQTPQLTAFPSILDFGSVSAGSVTTQKLRVQNTGTLGVSVDSVGLDLEFGAPFEIVSAPTTPLQLDVGEEFELKVQHSPAITGVDATHGARLRFRTDHPATDNRYVDVRAHVRHQQLVIKPGSLDFGWVTVGKAKTSDIFFKNVGSDPVTVESFFIDDGHESLTLLGAPEPPFVIAPAETLTLTARFAPEAVVTTEDALLGTLRAITNDYVLTERAVPIHGRGGEPAIAFIPDGLADFGVVAIGHQHARDIKVVNTGQVPLTLNGVAINENSAPGFKVLDAPTMPIALAPSGMAEIRVAFHNPEFFDQQVWGQLEVSSDDPVVPEATLDLRALTSKLPECLPRFVPSTVEFGTVAPASKKQMSFKVVNDGSMPCRYVSGTFLDCKQPTGLCSPIFGGSDTYSMGTDNPPTKGRLVFYGDALEVPVWFEPQTPEGEAAALAVLTFREGPGEDDDLLQYHAYGGGALPSLHGSVGTAGVIVKPNTLAFGLTTIGCGAQPSEVGIFRIGPQPIKLESIDASDCGPQVQLAGLPELPVPLWEDPAAPVPMQVQFSPAVPGFSECVVNLVPDHPDAGIGTLTIAGVGTEETKRTDFFKQADVFEVDILFVVDSSGSMKDEQESLAAGFDGFVAQAADWEFSYQIGVVTTDMSDKGMMVGTPEPYVNNDTWELFKDQSQVGTQGSGDEKGLQAAWLALQPEQLMNYGNACFGLGMCKTGEPNSKCLNGTCGGPNQGFIRDGALLAIIWVSDEEDHSGPPKPDPEDFLPVGIFVDYFKSLKPENKVRGYAIVGDPSTPDDEGGCNNDDDDEGSGSTSGTGGGGGSGFGGTTGGGFGGGGAGGGGGGADPGDRYVEAAEALGGFWISICKFGVEDEEDEPLLEKIGKELFKPQNEFALTEVPAEDTIEVEVNGQPCTDGWVFDADSNSVIFDSEVETCFPGPAATISVVYEPVCYDLIGQ